MRVGCLGGLLCGLSPAQSADYFPLQIGNRWEYQLEVSADGQVWQVSGQQTVKQIVWFVIGVTSTRQDLDGKIRIAGLKEFLVRADGDRLVRLDRSKNRENVWIDFAAAAGQAYLSPGACHTKATNSPGTEKRFVVLYDRTCADAGLLNEAFVAGVGLESFAMDSFVGPRTWKLIAAHVDGKDLAR